MLCKWFKSPNMLTIMLLALTHYGVMGDVSGSTTPNTFINVDCPNDSSTLRQKRSRARSNETNSKLLSSCNGNCSVLPATCYSCDTSDNCIIGTSVGFNCTVMDGVQCVGERTVAVEFQCRYCYLTKLNDEHTCKQGNTSCKVNATPPQRVKGSCTVKDHVFCLGKRTFSKMMPCSWTTGYSWPTALALSITVGGFGIDRFYLGYWREGLGKFFSFGGLGVWTLIDVVLIGSSYLGPADGSLYVH